MHLSGNRSKGKVKISETMKSYYFDQNVYRKSPDHIKFHNHNVNKVKHKIQGHW